METRKPHRFSLVGLLVSLLLFAAPLLLFAAPLQAQRDSKFMQDFKAAVANKDRALQDSIMKSKHEEAVYAIVETCQLIGEESSAELEKEIAALSASWRRVYKTEFADSQYKYFSLMKPAIRDARKQLIGRYLKLYEQLEAAIKTDKGRAFAAFGSEFLAMSENFEEFGDRFMASVAADAYATCFDSALNGEDADLKRACEGYGLVVKYQELLELKGDTYQRAKAAFDELEFQGFGDPDKGPEARKRAKAEIDPTYKAAELEMHFELAPEFDDLARPNYAADSVYQTWHTLSLTRVGSSAKIEQLGDSSPWVLRQSEVKVSVDSDGDGIGDTPVETNGNLSAVQFPLGKGDTARQWGLRAITGSSQDTVQGIRPFNLAADESNMAIYIAPAGSLVGTIAETRFQLFDDNMDGLYGSEALGYGLWGLRQGDRQYEVDSMLIGNGKRALPWSERVKIGEDWYALFPKPDGSGISYSKVDLETGSIKLDVKGLDFDFLLIQGTGNNRAFCFDIANSKKPVEVPAGSYALLSGMVSKGSKGQRMKAIVNSTSSMPLIKVVAGQSTTLAMGSPYEFDFEFEETENTVKLAGGQIVITGRGGETYQRLWNCRVQPEVSLRKQGSKKGTKGEKMRLASDQNELTEAGYAVLWSPYDLELEKPSSGKMEVQLYEKKNKLFGKITSEWKGE